MSEPHNDGQLPSCLFCTGCMRCNHHCKCDVSDFDDYQRWTRTTAIYPKHDDHLVYAYLALGLAGEAGEVAEHFKKYFRDCRLDKMAVVKELGDVLWYLARLADELGFHLSDVAAVNKVKLTSRQERGVLKGSGDDR